MRRMRAFLDDGDRTARRAAQRDVRLAGGDARRGALPLLGPSRSRPTTVVWHAPTSAAGLFAGARLHGARPRRPARRVPPCAPAAFLPLSESVVLHRDPDRFALLYRLLWRFQVEPGLRADPIDPDWLRADAMAQAVRRDMHKMKAFVRFRRIDGAARRRPLHVAWFEPEHHIVEATAPFFVRRFAAMRWAILTPERSVRWDGAHLAFGARRAARPGRRPPTPAKGSGSPTTTASSTRRG